MELIKKEQKMTVAEVAQSLGVDESTVRKYVNKIFPEKLKNGIKTWLNEEEVTAIKLKMQENQHLGRSSELPKTDLEKKLLIQQAMGFLNEEIESLKEKVEHQALELEAAQPKIDFVNHIETSDDSITVAEFAKLLYKKGVEIGQIRLFKYFYDQNYLRNRSEPYQKWMDMRLFEIKKTPYGDKKTDHKVMVTGKGQTYLTEKICRSFRIPQPLNSQTQF